MSGLIIRRAKWLSVTSQNEFMGSCWAHAARLLAVAQTQLRVCFVGEIWLDKRGDNDSFLDKGVVNRLRIAVDGYQRIANRYFGAASPEAAHVRRFLRNDLPLPIWMHARRLTLVAPERESRQELDRLMDACYGGCSGFKSRVTRSIYHHVPTIAYRVLLFAYRNVHQMYRLAIVRN